MSFYAHSNGPDKTNWQTVYDHLNETAKKASELGEDSGLSEYAYIAALLHDIGKYTNAFQRRLDGARAKVDHSTAGVQEVLRLFNKTNAQNTVARLLAFCIAGHHGGLPDYGSVTDLETDGTLLARIKRNLKDKDFQQYAQEINLAQASLPPYLKVRPISGYPGFTLSFFTRMIYSALVDADFQDTETFMSQGARPRGGYPDLKTLSALFNHFLNQFETPVGAINQKRTAILKECLQKSAEKPGFFTLTVPTGGGKTFSSMAFALNHAVMHGMKRIIYVIPYTSIIEQNAAAFKKCLGEANVLEHHANFEWRPTMPASEMEDPEDKTDQVLEKLKLASENWDVPIVVTTNVQFFESLFANRSSRCRKLHNMARSVVIFDEAQMLPREYLKPCLYAVHELVKNYGVSAVFCTATQPAIQKFFPQGASFQELTSSPHELYTFFKRVQVVNAGKVADEVLVDQINDLPQVLCIVNTRKHASGIFAGVYGEGRFHLSTLMCAAHRKATIQTIRERLKAGLPCRVISTQIMEAGIDVDFPVGYRALSGLDSIIQAAGRVNREGKQTSGTLFVFEPDSAFVKRTPAYIQQGAQVAKNILRDYEDPVCGEAIQAYFELLYTLQDPKAFDAKDILGCFDKNTGQPDFDFKTAAEKFRLIENTTVPVLIPYNQQARELLEKARMEDFSWMLSREMQGYTVNIYQQEFDALQAAGLIDQYHGTYCVLNDMDCYDDETGLVIPQSDGGDAIFFDG